MSTKATTKSDLVFVGLDVHKDSIQVCILNRKGKELYNRSVNPEVGRIVERILRFGRAARARCSTQIRARLVGPKIFQAASAAFPAGLIGQPFTAGDYGRCPRHHPAPAPASPF